jgi:pimeloyl-ACP methyl ester carboxylesterase
VVPGLEAAGIPVVAVDLPSAAEGEADAVAASLGDLHDDTAHVTAVLDAITGPVVLVGHSYGGVVITEAGVHPSVARLVYVAAMAVDEGESALQVAVPASAPPPPDGAPGSSAVVGAGLGAGLRLSQDRSAMTLAPEVAAAVFYQDCAPADVEWAVARLRAQSRTAIKQAPAAVAWRAKPSTYAVCTEDRTVPLDLQRFLAARCRERIDWPTGHTPMLARPDLVLALLTRLARHPR